MEQKALNEALALYKASVRQSPALMMETVNVDSNRGVTARGNSPYDKFASPDTRAKVLESRMQEIAAFAQSRSIPTSNIYALAEAAMRTGKIPDMGQFGLAGDDAVATKQFLISNVLNIAGLEWTDYKGDPVEEAAPVDQEREAAAAEREARRKKIAARRAETRTTGGYQMSDSAVDPSRFMTEGSAGRRTLRRKYEGAKKATDREMKSAVKEPEEEVYQRRMAPHREREDVARQRQRAQREVRPPSGHERVSDTAEYHQTRKKAAEGQAWKAPESALTTGRESKRFKSDTPVRKERGWGSMADMTSRSAEKLRKARGIETSDVTFDPSRYMAEEGGPYRSGGAPERGSLSPTRMSSGGESPATNIQNYEKKDLLPKGVMAKLKAQVGDGIHGYTREDLFRLARERGLLGTEEDVQTEANGIVGASTDSTAAGSEFAPNPTQYDVEDELLKGKKKVKEDRRSETDKILGIVEGDPRAETWPKLGDEMARLLNLESDAGIQRSPRGLHMDEPEPEPIQEMTNAGGMGAFMGAGMMGGMTGRTCAMPSYDDSYELPEDPDKRIAVLKQMLDKHGLKKPVKEESDEDLLPPSATESPVVRDEGYDSHPSRFMDNR